MPSGKKNPSEEKREKARKALYNEKRIEKLKEEFDLSKDAKTAAIIIYRMIAGLGKGLTDSQKSSYSALAIRMAAEEVDGEHPRKKNLAEAAGVSHRTLTRRFRELEDDEESKKVLDHLRERISKWNERKEQRLQEIL